MISNRPTQAARDQGASPSLHHRHLSRDPAPSTTQSAYNNKHHQHCPSNHSDDLGVAHHQLNPTRVPVRPHSKALAMQRLTSTISSRVVRIQQPLLQPQSHSESPPLTYFPANIHLPRLLSATKLPTSDVLQRLHVTSHQLTCSFTAKKSLPRSQVPAVIVHAVNRCPTLKHLFQPTKLGKGRGTRFQKTMWTSITLKHPLNL